LPPKKSEPTIEEDRETFRVLVDKNQETIPFALDFKKCEQTCMDNYNDYYNKKNYPIARNNQNNLLNIILSSKQLN
jgi:hypothetical protein